MEGKSEAERIEEINQDTKDFKSVRILKRQVLPDGGVSFTVSFDCGNRARETSLVLTKVGNDWKFAH